MKCSACNGEGLEPGTIGDCSECGGTGYVIEEMTWIRARVTRDTGKTLVWSIETKDDHVCLGEVKWFGRWRGYAFFPIDSIFEQACLRDIADFLEARTKAHRAAKRKSKGVPA